MQNDLQSLNAQRLIYTADKEVQKHKNTCCFTAVKSSNYEGCTDLQEENREKDIKGTERDALNDRSG